MSDRLTAVELARQNESNEMYARQRAIDLAHTHDREPEDVVRRAAAYYKFIIGETAA